MKVRHDLPLKPLSAITVHIANNRTHLHVTQVKNRGECREWWVGQEEEGCDLEGRVMTRELVGESKT